VENCHLNKTQKLVLHKKVLPFADLLSCTVIQVVRSVYRFTSEDEEMEGKLTSLWEEFLVQLHVAGEHVALQAPLIIQTLDEKLQVFHSSLFTRFVKFLAQFAGIYFYVLLHVCSVVEAEERVKRNM